jgi:predicted dienelactone hydrolase
MPKPIQPRRLVRRLFKAIGPSAILAIVGIALLFLSLRFEHRAETFLPTPTGPFAVGRALYDWVDDQTIDTLAPAPGTMRELLGWIWYPATPGPPSEIDDYLPAATRAAVERQGGVLLTRYLTRDLSKVHAHSLRNAAVSPQQRFYPVVILRAGASLEVSNYSSLAEDLSSHGYLVVGLDAPYRTRVVAFPNGRVMTRTPENNPELCIEKTGPERDQCLDKLLTAWTADIGFVLDQLQRLNTSDPSGKLTGRLDLARVGVFGHSFGGAQAAQFCSQDSRCKAGIDVDGSLHGPAIRAGIHVPFMFLESGQGDFSSDAEVRQFHADIQSVYDRLPANAKLRISIRGANHFTFGDDAALLKSHIVMGALHKLGILRMDGRRQLAVTSYCLHYFFDAHLKQSNALPPKISSALYPEIQVLE